MSAPLSLSQVTFSNLLSQGWQVMKKNFGFLAGAFVITLLLGGLVSSASDALVDSSDLLAVIFTFVINIGYIFISLGWFNVMLKAVRGQELSLSNFTEKAHQIVPFIVASILVWLIVTLGLIFLLIPGIYFGLKYQFVHYLIVDKELSAGEAMKASGQLTDGFKGKLFWYGLGFIGVNILGVLALGIGFLVTAPLTSLAYTVLYEALLEKLN